MARELDALPARTALVEIARDFHARGWMAGTAGNLSARDDPEHFWITRSGVPKGRLDEQDFLLLRVADSGMAEPARAGHAPSAETAIHGTIYRLFPRARACLHVHSVAGCVVSGRAGKEAKSVRLPAIEMLKGLDVWEAAPEIDLPLFENQLQVAEIARAVQTRFAATPPAVTALLVRDHGVTVWGDSLQQAYNRVEVLEFLLEYMARA